MKAILTSMLVGLLVVVFFIGVVNANPGFVEAPAIHILSPERIEIRCYTSTSMPVRIEVLVLENDVPQIVSISYSLDSGAKVSFVNFTESGSFVSFTYQSVKALSVSSTLNNLANGMHALKAYSLDSEGREMSREITFFVNTTYVSPKLSLISPQGNQVYTNNKIPLNFWANWDVKSACYYLDDANGDYL